MDKSISVIVIVEFEGFCDRSKDENGTMLKKKKLKKKKRNYPTVNE
jgi:hypothetical protein